MCPMHGIITPARLVTPESADAAGILAFAALPLRMTAGGSYQRLFACAASGEGGYVKNAACVFPRIVFGATRQL